MQTHFWSFDNRNQQPASTSSIILCMNWEFNKGWPATETAGSSKCLKNNIKPIDLWKDYSSRQQQQQQPVPCCLPACLPSLSLPAPKFKLWMRESSLSCGLPACLPPPQSWKNKGRERGVWVAQTIDFVRSQALLIIQSFMMMLLLVFPVPKMISDTHLCSTLLNKVCFGQLTIVILLQVSFASSFHDVGLMCRIEAYY